MPPKKKQAATEEVYVFSPSASQLETHSAAVASSALSNIIENVDEGIFVAEVRKKIPDYNAEYCIELATNVNEIQIKSYDIKKDDWVFDIESLAEDEEEPLKAEPDSHILDRIRVKQIFRPVFSQNSNSMALDRDQKSDRSKSSVKSRPKDYKFTRKESRNMQSGGGQLRLDLSRQGSNKGFNQTASVINITKSDDKSNSSPSASAISPEARDFGGARAYQPYQTEQLLSSPRKFGRKKVALSSAIIGPVSEPFKIDMSYQKEIKREDDGVTDGMIDQLRQVIDTREYQAEKTRYQQPKAAGRKGAKSKKNLTKMGTVSNNLSTSFVNPLRKLEQAKTQFNSIQAGHIYENGQFVKARFINHERLPEIVGGAQKLQYDDHQEVQVVKPGEILSTNMSISQYGEDSSPGKQSAVFDIQQRIHEMKEAKKRQDEILLQKQQQEELKKHLAKKQTRDKEVTNPSKDTTDEDLVKKPSQASLPAKSSIHPDEVQDDDDFGSEPPPFDEERLLQYSTSSKEPITSYIQEKYLKSLDFSAQQVPLRNCLKANYGVVYKEGRDNMRQIGPIRLEGLPIHQSPEFKKKMSREALIAKQSIERPFLSSRQTLMNQDSISSGVHTVGTTEKLLTSAARNRLMKEIVPSLESSINKRDDDLLANSVATVGQILNESGSQEISDPNLTSVQILSNNQHYSTVVSDRRDAMGQIVLPNIVGHMVKKQTQKKNRLLGIKNRSVFMHNDSKAGPNDSLEMSGQHQDIPIQRSVRAKIFSRDRINVNNQNAALEMSSIDDFDAHAPIISPSSEASIRKSQNTKDHSISLKGLSRQRAGIQTAGTSFVPFSNLQSSRRGDRIGIKPMFNKTGARFSWQLEQASLERPRPSADVLATSRRPHIQTSASQVLVEKHRKRVGEKQLRRVF